MELAVKLSREELESIPYRLIAETRRRSIWNTGKRKRKMAEQFDEQEMSRVQRLLNLACQYDRNPPQEIVTSVEEITLWRKLGDFCYGL